MTKGTWLCLIIPSIVIGMAAVACAPGGAPSGATPAKPTERPGAQGTNQPPRVTPTAAQATNQSPRVTPTAAQPSKDTIKIATTSPLSGEQSVLGEAIKLGAQLAVKQLAKPLTDAGYKVELVPFDDQARTDSGVAKARSIIADPDILVVIGHLNSDVALAASDIYKNADLAMISPANTNPKLTTRGYLNVERVCGRDDAQGPAAAHFAVETLGAAKIYILHDKTSYGQGIATQFQEEAKKIGATIVGFDGTDERINFGAALSPIKAANPDLLYFTGSYYQAGALLKQMRDQGIRATFLGTEKIDNPEFARLAVDAAVGAYYGIPWAPASAFPDAAQFVKDYKAEFGKDAPPFAAQAYDATGIALKAITSLIKDGKPTRKAVAQTIRATKDYTGITGTFTFNGNGDPTATKYFIAKVASADPRRWEDNPVFKVVEFASPQ